MRSIVRRVESGAVIAAARKGHLYLPLHRLERSAGDGQVFNKGLTDPHLVLILKYGVTPGEPHT